MPLLSPRHTQKQKAHANTRPRVSMGRKAAHVAVAAMSEPHSTRTAPSDTSKRAPHTSGDIMPATRADMFATPVPVVRITVGNTSGVYVVSPATVTRHVGERTDRV